jgi:hypothetical protein
MMVGLANERPGREVFCVSDWQVKAPGDPRHEHRVRERIAYSSDRVWCSCGRELSRTLQSLNEDWPEEESTQPSGARDICNVPVER